MRLDKFLKVSRIIKRRTLAKEIADAGRILINDKPAKSSTNVQVNDVLDIKFGNKLVKVKIKLLLDSTKKDDSSLMYDILEEKNL